MKRQVSIAFQTDKSALEYIALAQLVDQYDFDVVSVYCDAPYHPSYMPLLLMAPHIKKARIGPAAVSPSRIHPIDIASQTALLAGVAQSGVYVGLARGAWLNSHGINELTPPVRAIREAAEIVQRLLKGESGYDGEVFQIAAHVRAPYPLPTETIPLLIGTWGRQLSAIAGQIADEVKIGGSANPDIVPVIAEYIETGEVAAGREPGTVGVVVGAVSVIDEDRDRARQVARRSVALYLPVVASLDPTVEVEPDLMSQIEQYVNRGEYDEAASLISDELLERFAFAGDPNDIIRQCDALFQAGARRIDFGTPHGLPSDNGIQLIGEKVLPALKQWR